MIVPPPINRTAYCGLATRYNVIWSTHSAMDIPRTATNSPYHGDHTTMFSNYEDAALEHIPAASRVSSKNVERSSQYNMAAHHRPIYLRIDQLPPESRKIHRIMYEAMDLPPQG